MSIQNTAITGLKAAATDLQVSGNNIANAGTVGFKQSRTEFADLFYSGNAGIQVGNGVKVSGVSQDFSNTGFSVTGGTYDMALNRDGFFVLKNPAGGSNTYTRAGNFTLDNNGYLTAITGERVQGYQGNNGAITSSIADIRVPFKNMSAPSATKAVTIDMNLDANSAILNRTFDATDSTSYNNRTSTTIYDSLGASHLLNTYFVKSSDNNWDTHVEVDGSLIGSGSIAYSTNGTLLSESGMKGLVFNPGGGAASSQDLNLKFSGSTQYSRGTEVQRIDADGHTTGQADKINVDKDGIITLAYSNGIVDKVAKIAVAKFTSPQELNAVGNSSWSETSASGEAVISEAHSDSAIRGGALENSNVDLTDQLVKLIAAQRAFQANAQSVRAGDMITQTVINLE